MCVCVCVCVCKTIKINSSVWKQHFDARNLKCKEVRAKYEFWNVLCAYFQRIRVECERLSSYCTYYCPSHLWFSFVWSIQSMKLMTIQKERIAMLLWNEGKKRRKAREKNDSNDNDIERRWIEKRMKWMPLKEHKKWRMDLKTDWKSISILPTSALIG